VPRRLATKCYAADAWTGDAHAGAYQEDVYADLKESHDKRSASFSHLVRRTFDEASDDFADGSIDLLHIDGYGASRLRDLASKALGSGRPSFSTTHQRATA
jgi:hypothetical protein